MERENYLELLPFQLTARETVLEDSRALSRGVMLNDGMNESAMAHVMYLAEQLSPLNLRASS